jgi:acyl carrier protein
MFLPESAKARPNRPRKICFFTKLAAMKPVGPELEKPGGISLANQNDNIEAEIVGVLQARIPAGTKISPQAKIARDLGLDSVAVMDFVMDIEDHFDISIPLDRIAEVETVEDLSRAVEALLKEKA